MTTDEFQFHGSTRPPARGRMLAVVGIASAALALGGLTGCGSDDEPTTVGAPPGPSGPGGESQGESAGDAGEDGTGGEAGEDTADDAGSGDVEIPEGHFAVGETAVYDNGLELTLSAAEPYQPSDYAVGAVEGNDAYAFTLTVANSGDAVVDADWLLLTAYHPDGQEAGQIFDDAVGEGFLTGLNPGETASADYAFSALPGTATLDIHVEQTLEFADPAIWTVGL
ncbi:hypothetical protein [Streptomyces sp. B6B3]|uniref:hypothetical protein n=1 Tax=Streptomyces sp. B6B3 TaxID=3153570 RepID=UPI00325CD017